MVKSFNLFLLLSQANQLINFLITDLPLTNLFVKNYASFYVANDIVALIKVKNLPKTTLFHHMMTTILLFVNYTIDYENLERDSLAKLLIVYTCFSCYTFGVNTYLGLRFLEYKNNDMTNNQIRFNRFLEILRISSYYIYFVCIICNWGYQVFNLITHKFTINRILYILALLPIINDDLVLLSWLKKKQIKEE